MNYDIDKLFNDTMKEVRKTRMINVGMLNVAFKEAKEAHRGQFRKSNEPYIFHPVEVMRILAQLGFESNILAAALLHDVVEDNPNFTYDKVREISNREVADIVDAVTSIKKDLHPGLSKNDIDTMSFVKLFNSAQKNKFAFYIKLADRIHNLRTIQSMDSEKQMKKAIETETILLPIARELNANFFISELEDLCFSIRNPDMYSYYSKLLERRKQTAKHSIDNFVRMFDSFFQNKVDEDILDMRDMFRKVLYNYPKPFEVLRFIQSKSGSQHSKPYELSDVDGLPLLKTFIIVSDDDYPLKDFYRFYQQYLYPSGFVWYNYDDVKNHSRIILNDSNENLFEINVIDEVNYIEFLNGSSEGVSLSKVDNDVEDAFLKKIIVYKKDGNAIEIEEGSTVLDFAFEIHEEIGLCAKYGEINGTRVDLNTLLNHGDKVNVISDTKKDEYTNYQAQFKWFLFLRTKKARRQLVKYFEENMVRI
jgi:GTP diphosphokinase / guanosine-3',5'-bis(diphosphate) 3'-diphosphatase